MEALREMTLTGSDWVKSLGGLYGEEVSPEDRFDRIVEKMSVRLKRLQQYKPSFMARTLYANSLLSACLWYFVYFVPPSTTQISKFDKLIHGMLWGRKPGSTDGTARVSMARLSSMKEDGGKNILQPSVMVEAIQANMVCRAIRQRGSWWCGRLELFLELAQPHRRGMDAILLPSTPTLVARISPFWGAALRSWQKLHWYHDPRWKRHREQAGATPLFGPDAPADYPRWFTP